MVQFESHTHPDYLGSVDQRNVTHFQNSSACVNLLTSCTGNYINVEATLESMELVIRHWLIGRYAESNVHVKCIGALL